MCDMDFLYLYFGLHCYVNTLRPRQNGRHFADDIFKRIFFNENVWISIKLSLKFVPTSPINKILALFQIMAWRRTGDKPLSEAMLVSSLTHKCVTRLHWVKKRSIEKLSFLVLFHGQKTKLLSVDDQNYAKNFRKSPLSFNNLCVFAIINGKRQGTKLRNDITWKNIISNHTTSYHIIWNHTMYHTFPLIFLGFIYLIVHCIFA